MSGAVNTAKASGTTPTQTHWLPLEQSPQFDADLSAALSEHAWLQLDSEDVAPFLRDTSSGVRRLGLRLCAELSRQLLQEQWPTSVPTGASGACVIVRAPITSASISDIAMLHRCARDRLPHGLPVFYAAAEAAPVSLPVSAWSISVILTVAAATHGAASK
jgi:hypothetical protein